MGFQEEDAIAAATQVREDATGKHAGRTLQGTALYSYRYRPARNNCRTRDDSRSEKVQSDLIPESAAIGYPAM